MVDDVAEHKIRITGRRAAVALGRELSEDEQRRLLAAIGTELESIERRAATKPHPVHLKKGAYVVTPDVFAKEDIVDEDSGKLLWSKGDLLDRGGRALAEPWQHCPDCGNGVQAGNSPSVAFDFLVCPRIPPGPLEPADRPCHEGCLVACGQEA
jgi:hypothetical protein